MPDIVRQPGARLTGQVDPRLAKRFYPGPLANLRRSYGAFHAFDKTHTVALAEAGLIPAEAARAILAGLREMEAQGIEAVRDRMGGGRHSGEAYPDRKARRQRRRLDQPRPQLRRPRCSRVALQPAAAAARGRGRDRPAAREPARCRVAAHV